MVDPGPSRSLGFTLVESLAVLVIVSILFATAIPAIRSVDESRAAVASEKLVDDLRFAQQRAIATGVTHWVVFDKRDDNWVLLAEDPENPERANVSTLIDATTGHPFIQQLDAGNFKGVRIVSAGFNPGSEVGFDPNGKPLNRNETGLPSVGTVTLSGNHQIQVTPETGAVSYVAP